MRHSWASECRGKTAYRSKRAAKAAMRHAQTNLGTDRRRGPWQVYRCSWCSWFHIGHASWLARKEAV